MTNTSTSSQGRSVSIWKDIGITFVVALVSYALGSMLINSFSQIRKFIIPIFVAIGLLAIMINLFLIKKYPAEQKQVLLRVTSVSFVWYFAQLFFFNIKSLMDPMFFYDKIGLIGLYIDSFLYKLVLFLPFYVLVILIAFNYRYSKGRSMLCLLNSITIFAITVGNALDGLMYAQFVSDDPETFMVISLEITIYAVLCFIFSAIALLIKKRIG